MNSKVLLLFVFLLPAIAGKGQVSWKAEFNLGLPWSVPSLLWISQEGQPDLKINAVWSSQAFELPLNWMWRIGRWKGGKGWEFETIHHKMVLRNLTDEVHWFGMTHGFNTLTLNRAWEREKFNFRIGAGGVLVHPESTVRDQALDEKSGLFNLGYYLTGPLLLASAARPLKIGKVLRINLEGTMTAGYASVPVADGTARTIAVAVHLHAGVGLVTGNK
ncbi:MAG: hypothetical protein V2A67_07330 [Bacteroidota bacterium]